MLKISDLLCFPLYLSAKEVTCMYNQKLKPLNLTYTQYIVMMYFWEVKCSNLKEISKTLMLDSSTLTPILKKLENKGFLQRARSCEDERHLHITLTEAGERLKEEALPIRDEVGKCVALDDEEKQQLQVITMKIIAKLREQDV